jgi:hypothetical protein
VPRRITGEWNSLTFDGDACRIQFPGGRLTVPVRALAAAELRPPGLLRQGRLTLVPRPGADPLAAVALDPLPVEHDPYVVEFEAGQADAAAAVHRELAAGIDPDPVPSDEFLVEVPGPPRRVRGADGTVTFDGEAVAVGGRRLPLAALSSVSWSDRRGRRQLGLRFVGTGPGEPPDVPVPLDPDERFTDGLLLAACVTVALQNLARPGHGEPPHGLALDGSTVRLYGLGATAEFDGAEVILTTQGGRRRIPLAAIGHVELGAGGDLGFVRVHLAGAADPPPAGALDPVLDVDTVCHAVEPAALEFTLRVNRALKGVERSPDESLLRTSGPRPDIAGALARASVRARGLVRELLELCAQLEPDEQVVELDLAVADDQPGLLALTGTRVLFLSSADPRAEAGQIPLRKVDTARVNRRDGLIGDLAIVRRSGREVTFEAVHEPTRFRKALRRLVSDTEAEAPAGPPRLLVERPELRRPQGVPVVGRPSEPPSASRTPRRPAPRPAPRPEPVRRRAAPAADPVDPAVLERAGEEVRARPELITAAAGRLLPGERIHELRTALSDGRGGLVAVTGRRVLFAADDEVIAHDLARVRDIVAYGGLGEVVLLLDNGARVSFWRMRDADRLGEAIRELRDRPPADPHDDPGEPAEPGEPDDVIGLIRRLGELREAGLLTEREFQDKKAELLRRL